MNEAEHTVTQITDAMLLESIDQLAGRIIAASELGEDVEVRTAGYYYDLAWAEVERRAR